jgi:hypothetical protein
MIVPVGAERIIGVSPNISLATCFVPTRCGSAARSLSAATGQRFAGAVNRRTLSVTGPDHASQ